MEMKEWIKLIKNAKTKGYSSHNLKVRRDKERKNWLIINYQKCPCCGRNILKGVKVEFSEAVERLSIFQAELLYLLFCENRKPYDYADYHKCRAGERFIKNIKDIEVI